MDLGAFDFRTGKMLMSKMNKSRQRVRYDSSNQVKVSCPACSTQSHWNLVVAGGTISEPLWWGTRAGTIIEFNSLGVEIIKIL